jgi:hypothetical protein
MQKVRGSNPLSSTGFFESMFGFQESGGIPASRFRSDARDRSGRLLDIASLGENSP